MRAFPNLTDEERERLAARGIDIEQSFRDWLAGMVGDRVDEIIEQAAQRPHLPLPTSADVYDSLNRPGEHGRQHAYWSGCRCMDCQDASGKVHRRPLFSHGTRAMYQAGCHCQQCRDAEAAYRREWKARRAA